MRVHRAEAFGMCFGVRDALEIARAEPREGETTVYGELVHNEVVLRQLRERGLRILGEAERESLSPRGRVLVTAHGISERDRERLRSAGAELVDTTCPLVRRAHEVARGLARSCEHVLVLGTPGHVEVRGLTGDLPSFDVIEGLADVRHYGVRRLGVLCQTTFPVGRIAPALEAVRSLNPWTHVEFVDTVCEPTRQRLRAVRDLAGRVDAMVVVGGHNSNNTRELVRMCAEAGVAVHHVQGPDDVRAEWFPRCVDVGLTAGTSTPDETVDAVEAVLRRIIGGGRR